MHQVDLSDEELLEELEAVVDDFEPAEAPCRLAALDLETMAFFGIYMFEELPLEQTYEHCLTRLAAISRGTFQPVNIEERWNDDGECVSLAFEHAGERHVLEPAGERFDHGLLRRFSELANTEKRSVVVREPEGCDLEAGMILMVSPFRTQSDRANARMELPRGRGTRGGLRGATGTRSACVRPRVVS